MNTDRNYHEQGMNTDRNHLIHQDPMTLNSSSSNFSKNAASNVEGCVNCFRLLSKHNYKARYRSKASFGST